MMKIWMAKISHRTKLTLSYYISHEFFPSHGFCMPLFLFHFYPTNDKTTELGCKMSLPVTYFDPSLDFAPEKRMRLGQVTHDLIFSDRIFPI